MSRRFTTLPLLFSFAVLLGCDDPPQGRTPPSPTPDPNQQARLVLERVVKERCLDPREPWALVHGILVYGADLRLPGDELAIDVLVRDSLEFDGGRPAFPARKGDRLVEPHPGTFVKTLLEQGVARERLFSLPGGRQVTLEELAESVVSSYAPQEGAIPFQNEAWQLEVVAGWGEGQAAGPGKELGARALRVLDENQAYFEQYLADPARAYEKASELREGRRQPAAIHRFYCGGLHFFQAVQRLHGAELPDSLARQYEILRYRLKHEAAYWDEKMQEVEARQEGAQQRRLRLLFLSQKLKLLGHGLETLLRAQRAQVPLEVPAKEWKAAWEQLASTVLSLEALGHYAELGQLRQEAPQLYLDLVGDSAHALHAVLLQKTP